MVAALEGTELDTGLSLPELSQLSTYWEQARGLYVSLCSRMRSSSRSLTCAWHTDHRYGPFECTTTMKSGSSDVYLHEIPGGQVRSRSQTRPRIPRRY